MRSFLLAFLSLLISATTHAQIKALTETGREVLLNENGSWKYADSSNAESQKFDSLKLNPTQYTKSKGATFLVKSKTAGIGIYINSNKWTFAPHKDNEVSPEYRFSQKSGGVYAMVINEKITLEYEALMQIALSNAQRAAADITIVNAEYRMVNKKKILCMEMKGTIKGIKFVYFGYYYTDDNGTTQLLTYTTQKEFVGSKPEMEEFLNGLVAIDPASNSK